MKAAMRGALSLVVSQLLRSVIAMRARSTVLGVVRVLLGMTQFRRTLTLGFGSVRFTLVQFSSPVWRDSLASVPLYVGKSRGTDMWSTL